MPNGDDMGTPVAVWRRPLEAGQPLPELPLPLDEDTVVVIDLEATYTQAAKGVCTWINPCRQLTPCGNNDADLSLLRNGVRHPSALPAVCR